MKFYIFFLNAPSREILNRPNVFILDQYIYNLAGFLLQKIDLPSNSQGRPVGGGGGGGWGGG